MEIVEPLNRAEVSRPGRMSPHTCNSSGPFHGVPETQCSRCDDMAKVDVVVPCYNYGRFLEPCVRSVLEQSVENVRVLIIDDGSSDDSLSVALKLSNEDLRVSVISHP